jgi:hypothetical protein
MEKKKPQMYAKDSLNPGNNYDSPACGSPKKRSNKEKVGWIVHEAFYTNTS